MKALIFGDSFANFGRFDEGVANALRSLGPPAQVVSMSRPGYRSQKLLRALKEDVGVRQTIAAEFGGRADIVFLLTGTNDFIQHIGARAFARDATALAREAATLADRVAMLELLRFNEIADVSGPLHRLKNRIRRMLDPAPEIEVYRRALRQALPASVLLINADPLMPTFEPARFKDGIHLTDAGFAELAGYAGAQLASHFRKATASI